MRQSHHLIVIVAALLLAEPALALRCQSRLVSEGDPQAKVLRFCGTPTAVQRRVLYRSGIPSAQASRGLVVSDGRSEMRFTSEELLIHQHSIVEVLIEEWTYNFGPRKLMRMVVFENGLVRDVRRLGYGYVE